jgi:hypothetical protein
MDIILSNLTTQHGINYSIDSNVTEWTQNYFWFNPEAYVTSALLVLLGVSEGSTSQTKILSHRRKKGTAKNK